MRRGRHRGFLRRWTEVSVLSILLAVALGGCGAGAAPSAVPMSGERAVYEGPSEISQDDTVIQGMQILHPLIISADRVVIRDCLIQASTNARADEPLILVTPRARGTVISGNEIHGPPPSSGQRAVSGVKLFGDDVDFSNNEISRLAGDAVTLDGTDLRVVNNYIHDFVARAGAEEEAVVFGGENRNSRILIAKNRMEMWLPESMGSLVNLPEVAPNMVVSQNWLAGGSYAVQGGGAAGVTGNRFSVRFSPLCGRSGTYLLTGTSRPGVRWSDNRWADGPSAGQEVGL